MKVIEYNRDKGREFLEKWRKNQTIGPLSAEYEELRTTITELYGNSKSEASSDPRKDYLCDVYLGLGLYIYLAKQSWFSLRLASNDNFWRYISVAVIPDIVADRWGMNNDNYFWKQSNRLWPKTAWWYVHLTWQGEADKTKEMLCCKNFNSDTIQGLVERTGRKGTFVEVYRCIIAKYSQIDSTSIAKFKKEHSHGSDSLFRAIMSLNTARCLVTDPCLCSGGVVGYVDSIISDLTKQ